MKEFILRNMMFDEGVYFEKYNVDFTAFST